MLKTSTIQLLAHHRHLSEIQKIRKIYALGLGGIGVTGKQIA